MKKCLLKVGDKVKILGEWDTTYPFNEESEGCVSDIVEDKIFVIFGDSKFMFFDDELEKIEQLEEKGSGVKSWPKRSAHEIGLEKRELKILNERIGVKNGQTKNS